MNARDDDRKPKRVLVCGGRHYDGTQFAYAALDYIDAQVGISRLAQGGSTGADLIARQWAFDRGIEQITYRADWDTHGKAAGPIRNQQMLVDFKPDLVVAFPGGRGTADMVGRAKAAGVEVLVLGATTPTDVMADMSSLLRAEFAVQAPKPAEDNSLLRDLDEFASECLTMAKMLDEQDRDARRHREMAASATTIANRIRAEQRGKKEAPAPMVGDV